MSIIKSGTARPIARTNNGRVEYARLCVGCNKTVWVKDKSGGVICSECAKPVLAYLNKDQQEIVRVR